MSQPEPEDWERQRLERAQRREQELRRLQRQRRLVGLGLLAVLAGVAAIVAVILLRGGSSHATKASAGRRSASTRRRKSGPARSRPRHVPTLALPANPPLRTVRVPILTYHRVNPLRPGAGAVEADLTIEPDVFAAEMAAIDRAGYHTVTQRQLFNALFKGAKLPPKPVLITADDGYMDDVKHILPVLKKHGMKATFYIITDRFKEPGFMNEDQVRALDQAGMDIGSHTHSHVDLTALSGAALRSEVAGSKRSLERVVGHPVQFFCYPSGRFDDAVVAAVRKADYVLAVTTQFGTSASSKAPLEIPRLHVGRGSTPQSVLALLGS